MSLTLIYGSFFIVALAIIVYLIVRGIRDHRYINAMNGESATENPLGKAESGEKPPLDVYADLLAQRALTRTHETPYR